MQDYSNSSALAMELLQSCTKPSIEPWRKWPTFCGQHFQMHFLEYKVCYLESLSSKLVSPRVQLTIDIIDSGNGLALCSWQAIIWINGAKVLRYYLAVLDHNVLWILLFYEIIHSIYPFLVWASLIAKFMGPTWGQQDPGGPHVGPMNLAIWDIVYLKL